MTRTKYEVWKVSGLTAVYVTEKHNAEYMLLRILKQHQTYDEFGKPNYIKVIQVIGEERNIIYTPRLHKFWEKNLVVT